MAAFAVLSLLAKGGLFDALRKMVAEYTPGNPRQSDIVSTALVSSLLYFCVVVLITTFFVSRFRVVPIREAAYLPLLLFALLFSNLFAVIRGAFYGLQREHVSEILQIAQRGIFAGFALSLAYLGFELTGVFAGYLISFVVVTVVGLWYLFTELRIHVPTRNEIRSIATELFSYGGTQLIGGLSALLLYKTDILLVRYFKDSTAAALYNAAIVPAEYVWFVPAVMQMAFLQRTASLWTDREIEAINDQIRMGIKYALLSLTLFGVGLYALAAPFLELYFGPAYLPARLPLQILIVGTFFFGISRVMNPVFQATGWIKYTEFNTVVVLAVNVLLNFLLIPRYGILGAAVATSSSYVLMFVAVGVIWWRSVFEFPSSRWLGKIVLVQAGFSLLFIETVSISNLTGILSLLVLPIIGAALFVVINVVTGVVEVADLYQLYE
jgi:O-antigen/teichoic acid export membrane protein